MAWEWVAPIATSVSGVAGVFFTWLSGAHGRSHAETVMREAQAAAERSRLLEERRAAYMMAVRVAEVGLRRSRYKREEKTAKLDELDATWPIAKRKQESLDAEAGLLVFGSLEVRRILKDWQAANDTDDDRLKADAHQRFLEQARRELVPGPESA